MGRPEHSRDGGPGNARAPPDHVAPRQPRRPRAPRRAPCPPPERRRSAMVAVRAIAIIPARLGSTRLPGKVLREIAGKPMIQWVYERAKRARLLEEVYI